MAYLKIGELAALTDTNNETLRFYESKALLDEPRRSGSGYRLYTEQDVERGQFVVRARKMGFSLKEIAELLTLQVDTSATCGEVKELAEQKLADIAERLAELNRMKSALQQITDACCGGDVPAENCTILQALEAAS